MFKKIICVLAFVGLFDVYFSLVLSQRWEWAGYETLQRLLWSESYNFYRLCAYGGGLLLVLMSIPFSKANADDWKSRDYSGQFKPESDDEKEQ